MNKIINLRQFKKRKKRDEEEQQAHQNRVTCGRSKTQKYMDGQENDRINKFLDQSKLIKKIKINHDDIEN